jgi:circadian clock protein KaiC
VTVVLVEEVQYVTGEFSPTAHHISYLADNIVFLRYLETDGHLRKAIGVLKKRYGGFENSLRWLSIDGEDGLSIGEPLTGYSGLLTGIAQPTDSDGSEPRTE